MEKKHDGLASELPTNAPPKNVGKKVKSIAVIPSIETAATEKLDRDYTNVASDVDIPAIVSSESELSKISSQNSQDRKRAAIEIIGEIGEEEHYRLKRRKIKVAGAPKMPLTGYVRYMNERREALRKEQPQKTANEHTKIIGEEWSQLSEEKKSPYMRAAEVDKQRYLSELHTFLKARPDVLACELAKDKARKNFDSEKITLKEKSQMHVDMQGSKENLSILTEKDPSSPEFAFPNSQPTDKHSKRKRGTTPTTSTSITTYAQNAFSSTIPTKPIPGEIPIFTTEFMEHNKYYDMELRALRKSTSDIELQNSVLEKHVENMKFGVEKLASENDELEEKNRLLEIYLDKLKRRLANALAGLALPTEPNGATYENIDKYMNDLYNMSTSNTHGPASLNKAKDIIRKLDLQIQF